MHIYDDFFNLVHYFITKLKMTLNLLFSMKFKQRSVPKKKSHNINKRSLWQTIWTAPESKQHISVYSSNNATSFVMAKHT